jgi:hypothetical protein
MDQDIQPENSYHIEGNAMYNIIVVGNTIYINIIYRFQT